MSLQRRENRLPMLRMIRKLRKLIPPLGALAALALAACSPYKPFDSAGFLRQQIAQKVGPEAAAKVTIPFELNDDVRAAMEKHMRPVPSELRQVNQVLTFIFEN